MKQRSIVVFILALAMIGQTTAPIAVAQSSPSAGLSYAVGTGDVLAITVYRAPDYSGVVEVADDGTVVLSTIGKVQVGGLTPPQIGAAVAERLRAAGIFVNPIVNAIIQTYRSRVVSVLGSVAKPGEYPLSRGQVRISEILAQSGAMLGVGGGSIQLIRRGQPRTTIAADDVLSGKIDSTLEPYDTLIVNEAPSFFISGEVQKAGAYPIEPNLTIGRAIALAGGLTPRGSSNRLKVTRQGAAGDSVVKVKINEIVRPKDLIVVGSRIF